MQVGVVFPQTETGADPSAVRDYVQAAEELGYSHVFIADHVLGADPEFHPQIPRTIYTHRDVVHEPLTLMAYIAAVTRSLQLVTGILILPQRQTALVAKQAAEVDVLSGGRLRLGIGVGWNPVEYQALGQDFHNRGRRSEEQIDVLRALWTQEVVDYSGRWHRITHAGLNPLPVQRPIPIWLGTGNTVNTIPPDPVLRRIAHIADGWIATFGPSDAGREAIARLHGYARKAGRDPNTIGMECRVSVAGKGPEDWSSEVKAFQDLGATHLTVDTRRGGFRFPQEHIEAIRKFKETINVALDVWAGPSQVEKGPQNLSNV